MIKPKASSSSSHPSAGTGPAAQPGVSHAYGKTRTHEHRDTHSAPASGGKGPHARGCWRGTWREGSRRGLNMHPPGRPWSQPRNRINTWPCVLGEAGLASDRHTKQQPACNLLRGHFSRLQLCRRRPEPVSRTAVRTWGELRSGDASVLCARETRV